jgi:hypothetical protein
MIYTGDNGLPSRLIEVHIVYGTGSKMGNELYQLNVIIVP